MLISEVREALRLSLSDQQWHPTYELMQTVRKTAPYYKAHQLGYGRKLSEHKRGGSGDPNKMTFNYLLSEGYRSIFWSAILGLPVRHYGWGATHMWQLDEQLKKPIKLTNIAEIRRGL